MKEKPNYYAILPANVRYDEKLKPSEKLLFAEITALSNKHGFCWSTNNYFAQLYDVTKVTVSNWISSLVEKGYLEREIFYKENSKEVLKRKLIPIKEKANTSIKENFKENNTRTSNTTSNNNKPSDKSDTDSGKDEFAITKKENGRYDYPDDYEEIYELYPANNGSKKAGWRKWAATRRRGVSKEDLTTAVSNYAKVCEREDRDKKYVKHIGTFFGPDEHWKAYLEIDKENINVRKLSEKQKEEIQQFMEG